MHSSIFSSSLRVAAFLAAVAVSVVALERYCERASRFQDVNHFHIKHFMISDPTNAVFGDSHVLWVSYIPGFSFFGTAGQQPEELNRIVRYLYSVTKPGKIIIEADPQWLGHYHKNRPQLLTDENLASRKFKFLLTSAYFYKPLRSNLISTIENAIINATTPTASASEMESPEARWVRLNKNPSFNWSWMPESDRDILTKQRVAEQNPIDDFASTSHAKAFRDAILFLKTRGAQVCLFRTPVTTGYLDDTGRTSRSNYAAYDNYIRKFSNRETIKYVDFRDLSYEFTDDKFLNSDHMTNAHYAEVWPLVAKACFDPPEQS